MGLLPYIPLSKVRAKHNSGFHMLTLSKSCVITRRELILIICLWSNQNCCAGNSHEELLFSHENRSVSVARQIKALNLTSMITLVGYTENTYSVSIVVNEILILEDLFLL